MKRLRLVEAHQIIKVIELAPIVPSDASAESLKFRIELVRKSGRPRSVYAQVWRCETYSLRPSFPASKGRRSQSAGWDKEILVKDEAYPWDTVRGRTPDEALRKVRKELTRLLRK